MGRRNLQGIIEIAPSIEMALRYHLEGNCFPPIPLAMINPCKRAIQKAKREEWDKGVRLCRGATWKGKRTMPVRDLINWLRLEDFLR